MGAPAATDRRDSLATAAGLPGLRLLAAAGLLAVSLCALLVYTHGPQRLDTRQQTVIALPARREQSPGGPSWLLLQGDAAPTDGRESRRGFKWAAGAILDDFALGMGVDDLDSEGERADNYANESLPVLGAGARSGAAAADARGRPQITDNTSHSKTRADLRAARERLERTPPPAGQPNGTIGADGVTQPARHSTRRKRRAGASASERGKPILNEFSFPANLVQGMRFVLMCQVLDGEPPIQIKWFKDNLDLAALQAAGDNHGPLEPASFGAPQKLISLAPDGGLNSTAPQAGQQLLDHIEMISNDELGSSLLFRKVRHQHSGNYTCLASNRFGTASYTSLMVVKVPPTWRVEPQDRESIMGEQISIDCQAVGNPNPFLRWKFTGVQHDKITADFLPGPPAQIPSLADFQPAALNQAQPHLGQPQHLQSFKLINSNHHVQTLENGSLIIRQAGSEHEGLYLCEADNGVEPSLVKQIKLIVHKQAHFLDDIQVLVQPAGAGTASSVTSAPAPGQPQPDLQQGVTSVRGAQKDQTLSIPMQQSNQLAPSIKVVSLPQNSSLVRLVCSPYGDGPIQLDWLKDGHLIHTHSSGVPTRTGNNNGLESGQLPAPSSSSSPGEHTSANIGRFHVSSHWNSLRSPTSASIPSGLDSELILSNLARHDAGLYTCIARNAFGQSERKLRLIVQEQPEAPTMVDVARISSRSISIRWLAPYDGNSPITKYVIEYRKQALSSLPGPVLASQQWPDNTTPVGRSEKKMPTIVKTGGETDMSAMIESPFISEPGGILRPQAVGSIVLGGVAASGDRAQVQHTIHDLEPLTSYSMRVLAVNSIGQSRPSVALSLRTEEEEPATVPELVEASVLSSRAIKLRWTISYSIEHELIDGFFIGYRSFDSSASLTDPTNTNGPDARATGGAASSQRQMLDRPTYTYKTIRLSNQLQQQDQHQQAGDQRGTGSSADNSQEAATPVLAPISSVTKTVPAGSTLLSGTVGKFGHPATTGSKSEPNGSADVALVVISNFEYVISGLERNTEYTILIQCYNKKGTGPSSDPVVTKTLMHDPPDKLMLSANELTETSLRLTWHFPSEFGAARLGALSGSSDYPQPVASSAMQGRLASQELVDGFVLTFAKIAQPNHSSVAQRGNSQWAKRQSDTSAAINSQKQQQQQRQLADSAARISKQSPAFAADSNFQYNPPIQPSQLLDHQWQAIQLASQQREHTLKNLECGTWYAMKIWAFNKVGKGEPSNLVTSSTRGKAPIPPSRNPFLSTNSTLVKLNLNTWYDGGCEIEKFVVQYRSRGQSEWVLVSNNILREQGSVVIRDLAPAAPYELLVGAQNHVGFSEAKYRFTTLDSDGRQVASSKSFLPILNGGSDDDNDGDGAMIDYSDDLSSGNANIRRESYASDQGNSSRWIQITRHILNSPLTLLLTFSVFLVLLGLLLFNRLGVGNAANMRSDHSYNSNGISSANGHLSSGKNMLDCGTQNVVRQCSLDGMTTMLDSEHPMSCTTNGSSSTSADSPGKVTNFQGASATMGRLPSNGQHLNNRGSTYGPLDCFNNNLAAYCTQPANNHNTSTVHGYHQMEQSPAQHPLNGWTPSVDTYSSSNNQQQQHVGFYSALPQQTSGYATTATVPRGPVMSQNSADHDQLTEDSRQQCLMQMLLISPQQQQQQQQQQHLANSGCHEEFTPSMTTAALATMSRQKTGFLKQSASGGAVDYSGQQYTSGVGNLTLGRLPTGGPHETFHPVKSGDGLELYQMITLDPSRKSERAASTSLFKQSRLRPASQEVGVYQDLSTTNESSSFASTSGCVSSATSASHTDKGDRF